MLIPVTTLLDPAEAALWQRYLDLEAQGLRRPALQALDDFLTLLAQAPQAHQYRFAQQVCLNVIDHHEQLPIRYPLFKQVLWPYLRDAYHEGSAIAPRWLAYFDQFGDFQHRREALGLAWPTRETLLRVALARDPSNAAVRRQLIDEMAGYFNYTLHELPAGVLYGIDGASVAECQELLASLREFCALVETENLMAEYQDRITRWQFHYERYADYLTCYQQYTGYADYLEKHGHG